MNCEKCQAPNPPEARFCSNCGAIIELKTKPDTQQNPDKGFCAECGCKITEGVSFCPDCGAAIGSACPNCGTDNEAHAKFCAGCGQPLQWTCAVCNHLNEADARFCANCGREEKISVKKRLLKPQYIAAVVIVLLVAGYSVANIIKLNNLMDQTYRQVDAESFDEAGVLIAEASEILLPFKQNKIDRARDYLSIQQEEYEEEQQRIKAAQKTSTSGSSSRKSGSYSSTGSNSSASNCNSSATLFFNQSDVPCIDDKDISISGPDHYDYHKSGYGAETIGIYNNVSGCIAGNYHFTFSFTEVSCIGNNPKKRYTYRGSFYLDGLQSSYNVHVYPWGVEVD